MKTGNGNGKEAARAVMGAAWDRYAPLLLVALLGTLVTLLAFRQVRNQELQRRQTELSKAAESRTESIRRSVLECVDALYSVSGLFASSQDVDLEEFATFASQLEGRRAEIEVLEWLPRVTRDQRAEFEKKMQGLGQPEFRIVTLDAKGTATPAPDRLEYFPSVYTQSSKKKMRAAGFDHFSRPELRAVMEKARDWGTPMVTAWFKTSELYGDRESYGFLVYLPIYANRRPHDTRESRQANLAGFAVAVISLEDLALKAFKHIPKEDVRFVLQDRAMVAEGRCVFVVDPKNSRLQRLQETELELDEDRDWDGVVDASGRTWHVWCLPSKAFLRAKSGYGAFAVLAGGVLLTLMVGNHQRIIMQRSDYANRLVTERTAELAKEIERRSVLESELARERDLFHTLLDNVPDRIYFKDLQSRFVRVNRAMAELFGLKDAKETDGKTDFDFFTPDHAQPAFDDEQKIIATGESLIGKVERETLPDGRIGWAHTTKMPFHNQEGKLIGTFGISRDITEIKRMEEALSEERNLLRSLTEQLKLANTELHKSHEDLKSAQMQLIQAEKLQSVGRLAAGVAHEVKNPLAILGMGIDYLSTSVDKADPNAGPVIEDMRAAIRRADNIILGLLDFSAPRQLELKETSLNAVIEQALSLTRHETMDALVNVSKDLAPDLPPVNLDPNKLAQVFVNLFMNAVHAMPSGGSLAVRSYAKVLRAEEISHTTDSRHGLEFRPGETVVVAEVDDSGTGIPEDKLSRVFDPFFTTKPTGQGTGLGLTVTLKIIELHHGHISIRNRPEGGVRVTVWLRIAWGHGPKA